MKYVVLGGAGAMGRITVKDLYETVQENDEVIIADYDIDKAETLAKSFNSQKVKAVKVDVKKKEETIKTLEGTSVIINSIQYNFNLDVMEIALALGAHYVDLGGLFHMTRKQLLLNDKFKEAGKTAVIGMGSAPGITNIMSAYGAAQLDTVSEIHMRLGAIDNTEYRPVPVLGVSYSLKTILEEFSLQPAVFTNGEFTFVESMSGAVAHEFPAPVGVQYPMYTIHSEVATLPLTYKDKGVKEVSFKIGFDPQFTAHVKFLRDFGMASHDLIDIQGVKVAPIDVVNKIAMSQPPSEQVGELIQYGVVRSIVKGTSNGEQVTWIVECHTQGFPEWDLPADIDTGCPPSIVAQMIANGQISESGVLAPEVAVDPEPFFAELERRNMKVTKTKQSGWSFAT